MFWYLPWSESIKKRACRYLLQRYLGNFLEEKLTLDQLSVDLYNGTGTVCDVSLDCEALNELGDAQSWPLQIVDGQMQKITVNIPWSTIFKDDSVVEVSGLSLTVQPKVRAEQVSSMLESMWSSMSSSMQLAADCLREEDGPQDSNPVEGIEMFAHAIDSILSRVKVRFVNTKIRIEHVPKNCDRGIALEIHIKNIDYFDEAGSEPAPTTTDPEKAKTFIVATYTNKRIKFDGVTLYTDEFPSKLRTMARSLIMERSLSSQEKQDDSSDVNYQSTTSELFYETKSVTSNIDSDPIRDMFEESKSEYREPTPEERANQPDPILFAMLTGEQELSLRLKHAEEVEGPKVEVKMLLGSFIVFMSPRQLHTLVDLVDALNQPHLEDTSNIPLRSGGINMQCKPMKQADFQLIEAQLLGNLERGHARQHMGGYGWSGPGFGMEESDAESEKFHPMTRGPMADSLTSSVSSMSASVASTTSLPVSSRHKRNKKVPHVDGDPTAEVSHVSLRLASLSCILLHKDILAPSPLGSDCITPSSANLMQETAREFYNTLQPFHFNDDDKHVFQSANEAFDKAAKRNHLRLLTSEVTIDGSEKVTSQGSQTIFEAVVNHVLVRECLYDGLPEAEAPQAFDIVSFDCKEEEDSSRKSPSSRANVRVNFKQTSKYMRISGEKKLMCPTTDITVKCQPVTVEVELGVAERMAATWWGGRRAPAPSAPQNHLNFNMHCGLLTVLLRFPVADMRAGGPRGRRVRADWLSLQLAGAGAACARAAAARPLPTTAALRAAALDLYYHENDTLPPTHIARSTVDDTCEGNMLNNTVTTPMPSISLTFLPPHSPKSALDDEPMFEPPTSNPMTTSMYIMNNLRSDEPSPFSAKKTAHQSFTSHEHSPRPGQDEELIVPGNEEEMAEFTSSSIENSAIHLEFNLPLLSLQLESKQLYEILYNRINSDLLLWEPVIVDQFEITPPMCGNIYPAFSMCKGTGYESESESSSSEEENLYYSTYDSKPRRGAGAARPEPERRGLHNFCLSLKVGKGLLTIYAPVRDANKRVVPGQMGELVLEAHRLSLCQVSGVSGRAKTAQLCLRAERATLYHDPVMTIPSEKPNLRLYGTSLPAHLKKTIYKSGKGVIVKDKTVKKDMFTMALKAEPDMDTPNMKTLCIALGLEQATLRHRGDKGIAWLTQLMDVLDVLDYPVPGYTPHTVLSELHVHLWDCAVDYRPLYLPIRTVVTLGNFTVSSNIIPETNTSCLRFLAQECTLFLSYIHGTKPLAPVPQDDEKTPDLVKDYVCVVDVGLFELSLRMGDKEKGGTDQPRVDLSASNNMVTVHTCWDSASALCRLVTYAAADGDSQKPYDATSRHTSICSDQPLETLVGLDDRPVEEIRELSPSEIQQVNDLMEEAMKESPNTTLEDEDLNSSVEKEKEGVEVFFFPDESNLKPPTIQPESYEQKPIENVEIDIHKPIEYVETYYGLPEVAEEAKPTNVQVARELGDPNVASTPKASPRKIRRKSRKSSCEANTDDEFCIVEQPVYSADRELEEPTVRWLTPGPVPLCDNHFTQPPARADVLRPPKTFPMPALRYTLLELSLTWNLYGGTDFRQAGEVVPAKKTVTIEGVTRKQSSPTVVKRNKEYSVYSGVSYSGGGVSLSQPRSREPRTRGGPMRNEHSSVCLSLTKVKFQHDVYPAGGAHASRQTLAVSNIEVTDKVHGSAINKLLCQYQLKDEPDRNNSHMLIVKAVHLRPEPTLASHECCLKISLLPLWFNLDQDTLKFLGAFFTKLGSDEAGEEDAKSVGGASTESGSRQSTPTHRPPVMSIGTHLRDPPPLATPPADSSLTEPSWDVSKEPLMETYEAERLVSENLIQLEVDFQRLGVSREQPPPLPKDNDPVDDSPIYFRRVVFAPDVPIRLDYVGKRVDLSAGPVAGLLLGLGQLNCSELTLKSLDYKLGLLGLEKLVQWALQEWLSDIKRHQLPGLLSGIGPMHSLLQIISGIRDLVWLPVEQWRRDGRLVHGLRRGAASFTARTAVAALDITARLLHLIQATAETAFDMLTPAGELPAPARRRRDSRHPADIREGVTSAYNTVKDGLSETAARMALAARREHGAGVLRQLPGAACAPLALAAAGAADLLGGVRAALAPAAPRRHADKWRHRPEYTD